MKPTHIILHCSDSAWGCVREINKWHKDRGWTGGEASKDVPAPMPVGYHFVILNGRTEPRKNILALDGSIECGRDLDSAGAHCKGYNETSIAICLVGDKEFTIKQFDSLKELLRELCSSHGIPAQNVLGHCETESGKAEGKTCPNFDASAFRTWLSGRI